MKVNGSHLFVSFILAFVTENPFGNRKSQVQFLGLNIVEDTINRRDRANPRFSSLLAAWPSGKAGDCKSPFPQFKSGCRLINKQKNGKTFRYFADITLSLAFVYRRRREKTKQNKASLFRFA